MRRAAGGDRLARLERGILFGGELERALALGVGAARARELLLAFLAGLVPALLWGQTVRWRLRQRLTQAERAAYAPAPSVPATTPVAPPVADEVAA